jgi:predicted nicotinamide N-methyase
MSSSTHYNPNKDLDNSSVEEECWGLDSDFELFAKYQVKTVFYPSHDVHEDYGVTNSNSTGHDNHVCDGEFQTNSLYHRKSFKIEFIEPNSPLDILNKGTSSTQYDATGHCVWAGAFLLIECLKDLQEYLLGKKKRIIEFGCGTGIGGLALALRDVREHDMSPFVCFTDTDPAVLEVCRRNCILNQLKSECYSIQELTWGEQVQDPVAVEPRSSLLLFDIGLATDVLYDIDLIDPLFASITTWVVTGGIFILSHIPRACYNQGNPPEAVQDLEKYIVDKAEQYGLVLDQIIRPPSCPEELSAEILKWCPKSAFYGAGVFVFVHQKKNREIE